MLKIMDNSIWRGPEKVGWLEGHRIYARDNTKLGYYDDAFVYNANGHKIGYFEGDRLKSEDGKLDVRLEDLYAHIDGGGHSDHCRAAVRLLLGE